MKESEKQGAKAVNFGAVYGIGAAKLADSAWKNYQLILDVAEAKRWLDAFAQAYPTFARWPEVFEQGLSLHNSLRPAC